MDGGGFLGALTHGALGLGLRLLRLLGGALGLGGDLGQPLGLSLGLAARLPPGARRLAFCSLASRGSLTGFALGALGLGLGGFPGRLGPLSSLPSLAGGLSQLLGLGAGLLQSGSSAAGELFGALPLLLGLGQRALGVLAELVSGVRTALCRLARLALGFGSLLGPLGADHRGPVRPLGRGGAPPLLLQRLPRLGQSLLDLLGLGATLLRLGLGPLLLGLSRRRLPTRHRGGLAQPPKLLRGGGPARLGRPRQAPLGRLTLSSSRLGLTAEPRRSLGHLLGPLLRPTELGPPTLGQRLGLLRPPLGLLASRLGLLQRRLGPPTRLERRLDRLIGVSATSAARLGDRLLLPLALLERPARLLTDPRQQRLLALPLPPRLAGRLGVAAAARLLRSADERDDQVVALNAGPIGDLVPKVDHQATLLTATARPLAGGDAVDLRGPRSDVGGHPLEAAS